VGIAGAQEELDDGGGGQGLAGAGGHLEQEAVLAFGDGILNRRMALFWYGRRKRRRFFWIKASRSASFFQPASAA
jgi:hypothetical protein